MHNDVMSEVVRASRKAFTTTTLQFSSGVCAATKVNICILGEWLANDNTLSTAGRGIVPSQGAEATAQVAPQSVKVYISRAIPQKGLLIILDATGLVEIGAYKHLEGV